MDNRLRIREGVVLTQFPNELAPSPPMKFAHRIFHCPGNEAAVHKGQNQHFEPPMLATRVPSNMIFPCIRDLSRHSSEKRALKHTAISA